MGISGLNQEVGTGHKIHIHAFYSTGYKWNPKPSSKGSRWTRKSFSLLLKSLSPKPTHPHPVKVKSDMPAGLCCLLWLKCNSEDDEFSSPNKLINFTKQTKPLSPPPKLMCVPFPAPSFSWGITCSSLVGCGEGGRKRSESKGKKKSRIVSSEGHHIWRRNIGSL